MTKIQLGDEVQCTITGFKGIAVGRTEWIEGCNRITVQPKCVKGKSELVESQNFDEPTLKIIKAKNREKKSNTGGPIVKEMRYGR